MALLTLGAAACGEARQPTSRHDTVVVYLAASLTRPFQAALDTLARRTGTVVQRESGASLEHARKITELHRVPDFIALADPEVFPNLLMPAHVGWYADFARNRMVVAYTDRSKYAAQIDSATWTRVLARPDVQVGRPDPDLAPAGYRTILMLQLAERYYHAPGLAARLLDNAPRRNMRPNAAELAALLQSGEFDYVYDYESVAIANHFRYVRLPAAIDLGDPARAADYRTVSVRVRGTTSEGGVDTVTFAGQPIVYALSIPKDAPHPAAGESLAAFILGPEGRGMLREAHVDMMDHAVFLGAGAPASVRAAAER